MKLYTVVTVIIKGLRVIFRIAYRADFYLIFTLRSCYHRYY